MTTERKCYMKHIPRKCQFYQKWKIYWYKQPIKDDRIGSKIKSNGIFILRIYLSLCNKHNCFDFFHCQHQFLMFPAFSIFLQRGNFKVFCSLATFQTNIFLHTSNKMKQLLHQILLSNRQYVILMGSHPIYMTITAKGTKKVAVRSPFKNNSAVGRQVFKNSIFNQPALTKLH